MNEDLKSSETAAQPLTKWADLTMHTLRMVVAYDPDTQSKRLCLLGPLSLAQRRVLAREDFYEEQGLFFRDELNFGLTQLANIFPYVRVVNKHDIVRPGIDDAKHCNNHFGSYAGIEYQCSQ